MGLSDNKSPILIVVAVTILGVAGWLIAGRGGVVDIAPGDKVYFVAIDSGDLIALPTDSPSPTDAPGGGEAVRAYVFGCGGCGQKQRQTTYLEKFTPEMNELIAKDRQRQERDTPLSPDQINSGRMVASPAPGGDVKWMKGESSEANSLMFQSLTMCDGKPALPCNP